MSLLIISTRCLRENPCREFNVSEALRRRGVDADLCTVGRDLSGLGYTESDLTDHPELAAAPHVARLRDFRRLLRRYDAVLLDSWKASLPLAEVARRTGVTVFDHDSGGGFDHYDLGSDVSFFKGPASVRLFEHWRRRRGAARPPGELVATGGVLHERWGSPTVEAREPFLERHRLDPARPAVLLFPKGVRILADKLTSWFGETGRDHNEWHLRAYERIVRAVADAGFSLIVKLHPSAYASYRTQRDAEYAFWERYPSVAVIDPEETYAAYAHCTVGLSVVSHSVLDLGYHHRPFIYVDSAEAPMAEELKYWTTPGLCRLPIGASVGWPSPPLEHPNPYFPSWVGAYCRGDALASVLRERRYEDRVAEHYTAFNAEFWSGADGKAAERIAEHIVARLRSRPGRRRRWRVAARLRSWLGLPATTGAAGQRPPAGLGGP